MDFHFLFRLYRFQSAYQSRFKLQNSSENSNFSKVYQGNFSKSYCMKWQEILCKVPFKHLKYCHENFRKQRGCTVDFLIINAS